jgi:EF hand
LRFSQVLTLGNRKCRSPAHIWHEYRIESIVADRCRERGQQFSSDVRSGTQLPFWLWMPANVGRLTASSANRVIQEFTMSIPSIGNAWLGVAYPATQPSSSKPGSAAGAAQNPPVVSSDTLTLSPEAQAMAALNANGITVVTIHSRGLSSGQQPIQPSSVVNGLVSEKDFEAMAASFGDAAGQADQDFAAMDTNGNGSISNAEMLNAMSATTNGNDALSQSLRQMMDANHDGSVSGTEYVNLETAIVSVEE